MLNCSDKHMKKEATAEGSVHSVLLRRFACSVCLQLFDSAAQQRVHERTEHGEDRQEFDVSNQAKHLLKQGYLSNHVYILIISHRRPKQIEIQFATTTVISCQHCEAASFKNIYGLKRHLAKHKCPLVDKDAHIQG